MISLEHLSFEVTRRCNETCTMCMRGDAENVDMSREIVQKVLLDPAIKDIQTILFTGGEPTLNESLICYIVELIMKQGLEVNQLSMVTNGKKFPKDILEAFRDYQAYCRLKNYSGKVIINFSVDPFHTDYPNIQNKYQELFSEFQYDVKKLNWVWKTGRSSFGDAFTYQISPMQVQVFIDFLWVMSSLYITAKGNYETMGDGMYKDMDLLNMGSVFSHSLVDILSQYGEVTYGSEQQFKRMLLWHQK